MNKIGIYIFIYIHWYYAVWILFIKNLCYIMKFFLRYTLNMLCWHSLVYMCKLISKFCVFILLRRNLFSLRTWKPIGLFRELPGPKEMNRNNVSAFNSFLWSLELASSSQAVHFFWFFWAKFTSGIKMVYILLIARLLWI